MPASPDVVQRIADFYATKPISISYDAPPGYLGLTNPGSNAIQLSTGMRDQINQLIQSYGNPQGTRGVQGLATLIHEALHTRPNPYPGMKGADGGGVRDPHTGLYSFDDEWQAHQLSYNLISDAMQRFFGIDPNSKLGQQYMRTAQSYGYGGNLGSPEAANAQGGVYSRRTFNL